MPPWEWGEPLDVEFPYRAPYERRERLTLGPHELRITLKEAMPPEVVNALGPALVSYFALFDGFEAKYIRVEGREVVVQGFIYKLPVLAPVINVELVRRVARERYGGEGPAEKARALLALLSDEARPAIAPPQWTPLLNSITWFLVVLAIVVPIGIVVWSWALSRLNAQPVEGGVDWTGLAIFVGALGFLVLAGLYAFAEYRGALRRAIERW